MATFRRLSSIPVRLAALFVAACGSVGPDYQRPELALPADWQAPREAGLATGDTTNRAWWEAFEDPLLAQLVETALAQNLDLRASIARLDSARALRGVAAAARFPQIDARGSYEHRNESENTPLGEFIPRTDIHSIGFDAAWELDLWGRVRRSVEAADRDLQVSEAEVTAVALSVTAEVARAYVDLRAAQRRLLIAQSNLTLQEQTLALVRSRLDAGLVGERDVAQAATNVETTRARLPTLESEATASRNRLAVLLGRMPGELPTELAKPAPLPRVPVSVAVGVPADLLRRRPDVRRAERFLAAEIARVGVGVADRYPRFTLGGTLGLAGNAIDQVFSSGSDYSGFGPSLRWTLFDGGRLKQRVVALEANAEAAQAAWEQTVLLALEETENAMTRFVREQARRASLDRAAAEARRAVLLAETQYREGLSDFQTVLDSQRVVANIEDDLASSDAAITANLIALFKALGGGLPRVDYAAR